MEHGKWFKSDTLADFTIKAGGQEEECSNGMDHGKLLNSGTLADFTIKAGGQEFRCHKIILASRSPVFERMVTNGMKAGNNMF